MSAITFTFHAPRQSLSIGRDTYNALVIDGESRVLLFGNELNADERKAVSEAFATDGGTVVLSEDAAVSAVRANVNYVATKAKRKIGFAKVTANTPESPIVGYVATLRK